MLKLLPLILTAALLASGQIAVAQDQPEPPSADFEASSSSSHQQKGAAAIEQQINERREATNPPKRSFLDAFWNAPFWKFLPHGGSGTMNSAVVHDPQQTPTYPVTTTDRERELARQFKVPKAP